jgi:hypothetical protein
MKYLVLSLFLLVLNSNSFSQNESASFMPDFRVKTDDYKGVIAQVPKEPYGEYGRPLFQSMSYGDTPRPDMPQSKMIYVDNSSINGLNQKYSVLCVNGVGLKSEPSN